MVCTKRDLLPDSIGEQKLGNYLLMRLKESNIKVKGIVVIGEHGYDGQKELREITEQLRNGRDVILIGTANAGKSTVLHHVFEIDTLTISKYPGTTLDFVPIPMDDYTLYDTPGFHSPYSIQTLIQDQAMEEIMPKNKIKPRVYQLTDDQSFAIGGILRVDFEGSKKYSITAYFADGVKIHRGKISDADRLWQQHKGDLLSPVIEGSYFKKKRVFIPTEKKVDLVIVGLGWICIHGDVKITVSGSDFAEVYMRKAMI